MLALQRRGERDRVIRPNEMWRDIQRRFAPDDPTVGGAGSSTRIPDAPGHPPAPERFREAMASQLGGDRPVPPAVGNERWLKHVPTAPCPALERPFTATEVVHALFPVMKRLQLLTCPADGSPCAGCPLCTAFSEAHDRWDGSPTDDAPDWRPSARTSKASGDAMRMEHFRWPRPAEEGERLEYRMAVGAALAEVFNAMLEEMSLPEMMTVYRTIMLRKHAKPGQQQDYANPDFYRPITLSPLLTKALGLVIGARIYHWATKNGIIAPAQIGFMPFHGGDWHVWTLTEALAARRRLKLPTHALFIDLRKAYDSVDPRALMAVLRRMGLPEKLVGLLEAWSGARRTAVSVNGVRTGADRQCGR